MVLSFRNNKQNSLDFNATKSREISFMELPHKLINLFTQNFTLHINLQ
jgi:hypothetical protein